MPGRRVGHHEVAAARLHLQPQHLPGDAGVLLGPLLAGAIHSHSERHEEADQDSCLRHDLPSVYPHLHSLHHQLARRVHVLLRLHRAPVRADSRLDRQHPQQLLLQ